MYNEENPHYTKEETHYYVGGNSLMEMLGTMMKLDLAGGVDSDDGWWYHAVWIEWRQYREKEDLWIE